MKSIDQTLNHGEKVIESFSKSVNSYHEHANIQRQVAEGLLASLRPWKDIIPSGSILEVGCGTGFLSELIIDEFLSREIKITDASTSMVDFTKKRLGVNKRISYEYLNVDEIKNPEPEFALIVSNFAAQWFNDTAVGLEKLTKMLKPGGLLLTAFPGNYSFIEWYECCLELGLPYTANPLPDVEEVVVKLSLEPVQIDYYENDLYQNFSSAMEFFKHFKEIGASISVTGKSLTNKQLKLLASFWNEKTGNRIKAKWHVVYLAAKKDM